MTKILGWAVLMFGMLVLVAGLAFLMAYPTMWAWNYVMPAVFKLPTVTLGQAFALNWLAGTFFKSGASLKTKSE